MTQSEPETTYHTTTTMRVELDQDQIAGILLEWAKSRGFTHRADVTIDVRDLAVIVETFTGGVLRP